MNKRYGAELAGQAVQAYDEQRRKLLEEGGQVRHQLQVVVDTIAILRRQLAEALLPNATPALLTQLDRTFNMDLMRERARLETLRTQSSTRLVEVRDHEDFQQRASLLDPNSGELTVGLGQAQKRQKQAAKEFARLDTADARWLVSREENRSAGVVQAFWRAITFAEHREQTTRNRTLKALGFPDWRMFKSEYDLRRATARNAADQAAYLEERLTTLRKLMAEHDELHGWVHRFEERCLGALRSRVEEEHLRLCDVGAFFKGVPLPLRPLAARWHALDWKACYLRQTIEYLEKEALDRQQRRHALETTRSLWARKPYESVAGDKTKWLKDTPEQKRLGTEKRLRWVRQLRRNLDQYQDWDDYLLYLEELPGFLPYDAFAWGCDDPMPYEGFTRLFLTEVARYRQAKGQAKADYTEFKRLDKKGRTVKVEEPPPEEILEEPPLEEVALAAAAVITTEVVYRESETHGLFDRS